MGTIKKYDTIFAIRNDIWMYAALRKGMIFNLGVLQSIANKRWEWLVQNWNSSLKSRFTAAAQGNQEILNIISDLDKDVKNFELGNKANPFADSELFRKYSPLLRALSLSVLKLTPTETILRDQEIERISKLDIDDFREMIAFMRDRISYASQYIGLGDADIAAIKGKTLENKRRDPTAKDLVEIEDLKDVIRLAQGIIFDIQRVQKKPPNLLKSANRNLDGPLAVNEAYRTYVPVPFEISLEHMAKKYLGDTRLWYELVTVNNLQPPFIDESGEKFDLLAPAAANNVIIVADRKEYVWVGSKVGIGSARHVEETRIVERVIVNENNTMVLFLSGSSDLSKYKSQENSFIRVYKPHTTRKSEFILLPLTTASASTLLTTTPTNDLLRRLDKAFLEFGIDILRDPKTGDFVIDANGNFKFAYGFAAVRQATLNALKTERGELNWHPGYGVDSSLGDRFYGSTDEIVLFGNILRTALLSDPRYQDVKIANVSTNGNSISVKLLVTIRGFNQPIPLAFAA
jgi:hypothetical protein